METEAEEPLYVCQICGKRVSVVRYDLDDKKQKCDSCYFDKDPPYGKDD